VFPSSINGELTVGEWGSELDREDLRRVLARELGALGARELSAEGDVITFRSTLFRIMLSTNLLATVRFGRIRVERRNAGFLLRYHVSLRQLVVVATIAVVIFFGIPLSRAPNVSAGQVVALLCAVWFSLVGGNWFITAVRFPRFLRRCAARSLESAGRAK
jgi:hypothetical protein